MARRTPQRQENARRPHGARHSAKKTRGGRAANGTPRAATSFDDQTFERLVWLAEALGVPNAAVIRDAVVAYVFVIRSKDDARAIAALQRAKKRPAQVAPGEPI